MAHAVGPDRANNTMQRKTAGIVFACVLLALPCNLAIAQERVERSSGTTGATAEDITIGPLNKEKLELEKLKLEQEVEELKTKNSSFLITYLTPIATPVSTVGALVAVLFGVYRWTREQRAEREKRD